MKLVADVCYLSYLPAYLFFSSLSLPLSVSHCTSNEPACFVVSCVSFPKGFAIRTYTHDPTQAANRCKGPALKRPPKSTAEKRKTAPNMDSKKLVRIVGNALGPLGSDRPRGMHGGPRKKRELWSLKTESSSLRLFASLLRRLASVTATGRWRGYMPQSAPSAQVDGIKIRFDS